MQYVEHFMLILYETETCLNNNILYIYLIFTNATHKKFAIGKWFPWKSSSEVPCLLRHHLFASS